MNKYVKIVYQTEPIGKEKIILYLTTFDKEAFEKDQEIERETAIAFDVRKQDLQSSDFVEYIGNMLNDYVRRYYEPYVRELQEVINNTKIINKSSINNVKNISNVDEVHCGTVNGNIVNSDIVYCTKVKGNIINCDKVIYK